MTAVELPPASPADIPEALRIRIAAKFVEACDLLEQVQGLVYEVEKLGGLFAALGDGVDNRLVELGRPHGMEALWDVVHAIAATIQDGTPSLSQPRKRWPDTATPLPR